MLIGRLLDKNGKAIGEISADGEDKAYYQRLSDEGRVACINPDCNARLKHVSAVIEDNVSGQFANAAMTVNGEQARVPHWRSEALEDHIPNCDHKDDPYFRENDQTFRQAILAGREVRININFDVGYEGLRHWFNGPTYLGQNGLWGIDAWKSQFPNALTVSARDVGVILHYMSVAKELNGQKGLKQLYFAREGSVQSCDRFVVKDKAHRIELVVGELYQAGIKTRKNPKFLRDTPRLFLFEASHAQQCKAVDTKSSELWGREFFIDAPVENYRVKQGLGLKQGLTNQIVLDKKGTRLWVVGTPEVSYNQVRVLMRKANDRALNENDPGLMANWKKPLFFKIRVDRRAAMIMAPVKENAVPHAEATTQPHHMPEPLPERQYALPLDGAPARTAAAHHRQPTRRSPRIS